MPTTARAASPRMARAASPRGARAASPRAGRSSAATPSVAKGKGLSSARVSDKPSSPASPGKKVPTKKKSARKKKSRRIGAEELAETMARTTVSAPLDGKQAARLFDEAYEAANANEFDKLNTLMDELPTVTNPEIAGALLQALLQAQSDATEGHTMLHQAAWHGNEPGVTALLRRGADADLPNAIGESALDVAIARGHEGAAALLRAGSTRGQVGGSTSSPFLHASITTGSTPTTPEQSAIFSRRSKVSTPASPRDTFAAPHTAHAAPHPDASLHRRPLIDACTAGRFCLSPPPPSSLCVCVCVSLSLSLFSLSLSLSLSLSVSVSLSLLFAGERDKEDGHLFLRPLPSGISLLDIAQRIDTPGCIQVRVWFETHALQREQQPQLQQQGLRNRRRMLLVSSQLSLKSLSRHKRRRVARPTRRLS